MTTIRQDGQTILVQPDLNAAFARASQRAEDQKREGNDEPQGDAYTLRQFRKQAATSVQYLVDGLVPEGAITLWFGIDKSMKSWATLDMGMALLQGRQFLGRPTGTVETFVYASMEQSDAEVMARFERLLSHGDVQDRVHLWRHPELRLDPTAIGGWLALLDTLPEGKVLLVIDPLRDYIGDGSEKDDDTIRKVKQVLRAMLTHRPGLTIVLLHHSVKAQSYNDHRDASGSGALTAMADALVRWTSDHRQPDDDEDDEPEEGEGKPVIVIDGPITGRLTVRSRGAGDFRMRWEWNPLSGLFGRAGRAVTKGECERILRKEPSGMTLHAITDALYGPGASKQRRGNGYPRLDSTRRFLKDIGATLVASAQPGGVSVWRLPDEA